MLTLATELLLAPVNVVTEDTLIHVWFKLNVLTSCLRLLTVQNLFLDQISSLSTTCVALCHPTSTMKTNRNKRASLSAACAGCVLRDDVDDVRPVRLLNGIIIIMA